MRIKPGGFEKMRIIDKSKMPPYFVYCGAFSLHSLNKFFTDDRFDERNTTYTFNTIWYYEAIPAAIIGRSTNLVQNPGY